MSVPPGIVIKNPGVVEGGCQSQGYAEAPDIVAVNSETLPAYRRDDLGLRILTSSLSATGDGPLLNGPGAGGYNCATAEVVEIDSPQ